jgi:hypothetical protein
MILQLFLNKTNKLKIESLEEQLISDRSHSTIQKSSKINNIIERILQDTQTGADLEALGHLLENNNRETISQLGKYNINIGDGKDIHIGDRIYNQWDEDAIKTLVIKVIQDNKDLPRNIPDSNQQGVEFRENHEDRDLMITETEQCATNLSEWLDNIIDSIWQIADPELLVSFKIQNNQRVARTKQIKLEGYSVYLLVSIMYIDSNERSIFFHVYPAITKDINYLPFGFQFNILDSSEKFIQKAIAIHQDKWMKQEIRGKRGERFSINLKLNDCNVFNYFIV